MRLGQAIKKNIIFITLFFSLIANNIVAKEKGDIKAGLEKSGSCVACHGADGNSVVPEWPKIAGQHADYLAKQLLEYKMGAEGPRNNGVMYGMVAGLSEQDMYDLAAYYASKEQTGGKAKSEYKNLGERIYRGGNLESGVTACIACHGPKGMGLKAAKFPRVSGQHAKYTEDQLNYFKTGQRANDPNSIMRNIAAKMSDEEIKAVSSYIEGLN